MNGKNEVFEYLIDQLRQQVNNNQCEDLAQEVQSLKNQLRDASALVAELQETIKLMNEDFNRATNRGGPLPKGVSHVVGEHGPEQSGCRKEDAQECEHEWRCVVVFGDRLGTPYCRKCGVAKPEECEHDWYFYDKGASMMCKKCGLKK